MQPQNFTISYTGGTGNDVVLTAQAVVTTTTTTTLTSSVNPSEFGQSVTFTATVTPGTGTATPTGTVTFLDVTSVVPNELATAPLNSSGVATLTISSLPPGSNDIVALYNGGGVFGGSAGEVDQVVTAPVPALDGRALALLALVFAAIGFVFLRAK